MSFSSYDVVILGAGYAGLMAALRLGRGKWRLCVALVNARDHFLERVRLQESIVAAVAPRIVSIPALVAGTTVEFIHGRVLSLDPARRRVRIATVSGEQEIAFDQAIYALGSEIEVDSVPGAAEHAYRLDAGDGSHSVAALRSRLKQYGGRPARVIVVGGAETGIEVAGEIKTAWPSTETILISRSRCGDFNGPRVEDAVRAELSRLGVELIDGETVSEVRATGILTATGRSLPCDVCVWAGGLRSPQIAREAGLATDSRDRILVDPSLRSISHNHILAVGDAAHPIGPTGARYRLSAYVAVLTGAHAADVIGARRNNRQLPPIAFSFFGQGVAIGRNGVGFFSYPDDRQSLFILEGRAARLVRNFFVWFFVLVLRLERRFPGSFFWPGRRRVSWQEANGAIERATQGTARAA